MSDKTPADSSNRADSADDFASGSDCSDTGQESSISAPRPDALLGTTLAGRFKILEPIARGGMGTVYKAEQLPLGRICAVKTMHPTFDEDLSAEFHRRFFNEAAVASKLSHPNTVTVFDYGHEGELYFIAMELIVGKTLKEVLAEEGPLRPIRAVLIAMEIARSLREAHALGVVHRDIKPANVCIVDHHDERDTIKVLDFGLVKSVKGPNADTVTTGGICVGSPSYMAPEQVDGDEVSPATDIYSLGVVLFEMLCGRPPFVKSSKYALVMAHLSEQPPLISDVLSADKFPKGLEDVVSRCLEKAPGDRFANLDETLAELQRLVRGETPLSTTMMQLRRTGSGERAKAHAGGMRDAAPSDTPTATSTGGSVLSSSGTQEFKPAGRRSLLWGGLGLAALAVGGVATYFAVASDEPEEQAAPVAVTASVVEQPLAPPSAEVASAASETAPAVKTRNVHIESTPPGARVEEGDVVLCESTPCDGVFVLGDDGRPTTREVKLTLPGYHASNVKIAPSEKSLKVALRRIVGRGPRAPAAPAPKKTADDDFELSPY